MSMTSRRLRLRLGLRLSLRLRLGLPTPASPPLPWPASPYALGGRPVRSGQPQRRPTWRLPESTSPAPRPAPPPLTAAASHSRHRRGLCSTQSRGCPSAERPQPRADRRPAASRTLRQGPRRPSGRPQHQDAAIWSAGGRPLGSRRHSRRESPLPAQKGRRLSRVGRYLRAKSWGSRGRAAAYVSNSTRLEIEDRSWRRQGSNGRLERP
mmetsp:Transcript_8995/g.29407  ORF Transcript_8995/g.29407 Transcript_8995/m.29407 type:complete len:209 (+) Transcript_8995:377-1003(+)